MKKQTKANIFLGIGVIWFWLSLNGLFHVFYYMQNPTAFVSDYFNNPVAFSSFSEAQGYVFGQAVMPFMVLIPALIYFFKVRKDTKKSKVTDT